MSDLFPDSVVATCVEYLFVSSSSMTDLIVAVTRPMAVYTLFPFIGPSALGPMFSG